MTKRKIATAMVSILAIATLSIGASAAYSRSANLANSYNFSFSGYGGSRFSSPVTKTSNTTFAQYVAAGGNVSSSNSIWVLVTSQSNIGAALTESKEVTVINGTVVESLNYIKDPNGQTPGYGTKTYFAGTGPYYSAALSGTWEP